MSYIDTFNIFSTFKSFFIYANVLNYILFQSILTNVLCMFYVPISICMIAQSEINYYIIILYYIILYYIILYYIILYILYIQAVPFLDSLARSRSPFADKSRHRLLPGRQKKGQCSWGRCAVLNCSLNGLILGFSEKATPTASWCS